MNFQLSDEPPPLAYELVGHNLKARILALIPKHPEILEMQDAWDLFHIPGFNSADLEPSLAQAVWALEQAKHEYKAGKRVSKYRSIDED